MAFNEDLSPFFNTAEFADLAALTRAAGGLPISGVVIYDENGAIAEDYDVESSGPTALCPASQWPGVGDRDSLEIVFNEGARRFRVRSATPVNDGKLVLLALARLG